MMKRDAAIIIQRSSSTALTDWSIATQAGDVRRVG